MKKVLIFCLMALFAVGIASAVCDTTVADCTDANCAGIFTAFASTGWTLDAPFCHDNTWQFNVQDPNAGACDEDIPGYSTNGPCADDLGSNEDCPSFAMNGGEVQASDCLCGGSPCATVTVYDLNHEFFAGPQEEPSAVPETSGVSAVVILVAVVAVVGIFLTKKK